MCKLLFYVLHLLVLSSEPVDPLALWVLISGMMMNRSSFQQKNSGIQFVLPAGKTFHLIAEILSSSIRCTEFVKLQNAS
jgi:hypothetical protein